MAERFVNADGVHAIKSYIDGKLPQVMTSGDWKYRIQDDGTFEAWYKAVKQTVTINNNSGNLYRSALMTMLLPEELSSLGDIEIQHVEVNCSHNNYPSFGIFASFAEGGFNWYAMSGDYRSASPNYSITAYVFGMIT